MDIVVVGIDPAFANMGLCRALLDPKTNKFTVSQIKLVTTEGSEKKTVRKSSDDFRRAQELVQGIREFCTGSIIAFAEIPTGSQSARACWSLGIALGALAACPVPLIQVSPLEVKMASVGKKNASKGEIMEWAYRLYPDLPWRFFRKRMTNDNEHVADAIAIIHAGIKTANFAQIKAVLQSGAPSVPRRKMQ